MTDGVVKIHGREYKTVALRVAEFKEAYPEWSIVTELVSADEDTVVMKALVLDQEQRIRGTGYAEEKRSASKINKTSAMENAETSAIGRSLAACGFAGTEFASADEVANAISQQREGEASEYLLKMMTVVRDQFTEINEIKFKIWEFTFPESEHNGDPQKAREVAELWIDLTNEEKESLWVAPTKGGVFTTEERTFLKSNEFAQARKEIVNG